MKHHVLKGMLKVKSFNKISHGKEAFIYSSINTWNSLKKQLKHFLWRNLSTSLPENLPTVTHISCFMLILFEHMYILFSLFPSLCINLTF